MTPQSLSDDRSDTCHSRWLGTGRARARLIRSMLPPPRRQSPPKLHCPIVLSDMLDSRRGKPIAATARIRSRKA